MNTRIRPPDLNDLQALHEFRHSMELSGLADVTKIDFAYALTDDVICGVPVVRMRGSLPPAPEKVLMHIHGGGYIVGSARGNASIPLQISDGTGFEVVSIDYRLAPEHPYPAAVDDILLVYRELVKQYPANCIGVFGESAGGGLTVALVSALRDSGENLPGAIMLIAPFADLTGSGESMVGNDGLDPDLDWDSLSPGAAAYVANADPTNPKISPIYANFTGFPPVMIQAGDQEVLLSDAERIAGNAKKAGVNVKFDVWNGMSHCFQFDPSLPAAQQATNDISKFFINHM